MTRKEQDYNSAGKHVQKKGGRDGRVGGRRGWGLEEIFKGSIHVVAYRFLTFLFLIVDILPSLTKS